MTITPELFKAAMRQLAAGVCLVTTLDAQGRRSGLTATAVCSVSAEPPLLLVCVNQGNSSYTAIRQSGHFAVNVLAAADVALADRFASAIIGESRFDAGQWSALETGAPLLLSALAGIDCRVTEIADMGSHGVFFGEVVAVRLRDGADDPLLYGAGRYGRLAALP